MPEAQRDAALKETGLVSRGKTTSQFETGWYGLRVGGRYLVIGSGWDSLGRVQEAHAARLSTHGEAVFWQADDSTMGSRIAVHHDGALVWAFTHSSEAPVGLEGTVPAVVHTLIAEQQAKQEPDVDFVYEVAHRAGEQLVGFRHDVFEAPAGAHFELLRPVEAPPSVQRSGPFALHVESQVQGANAQLEALEAVEVRRVRVFEGEQLDDAGDHEGRAMAAGERVDLWVPKGRWVVVVTLTDGREVDFRPPSRGVMDRLKALLTRRRQ